MKTKFYLILVGFILTIVLFISIIILGLISASFSGPSLIPKEYIYSFVAILPGPIYTDILLLYTIPISFYYLHYLTFPYFSKTWIFFHKIIRRKSQYAFLKIGEKTSFYKLFLRAFYAALFSFSITTLISSFSGIYLFRAGHPISGLTTLFICEDIFLGTFFITPISIIIFFPLWQMEDSGLVTYRHLPEYRRTPEIEGVHALLYRVIKGYAGLSTIITLAYYIYASFNVLGWDFTQAAILTPLILIALPFLVMGLLFIPILLHEKYILKNTSRLRKSLNGLKLIDIPDINDMEIQQ
ncbi:MAG: hypothetical protein GF329_10875 [Candidatus Lokiarchaeota archaeon]|nr:hypothetical protein [Candidatus Lokiarchaeota archaeon]